MEVYKFKTNIQEYEEAEKLIKIIDIFYLDGCEKNTCI